MFLDDPEGFHGISDCSSYFVQTHTASPASHLASDSLFPSFLLTLMFLSLLQETWTCTLFSGKERNVLILMQFS